MKHQNTNISKLIVLAVLAILISACQSSRHGQQATIATYTPTPQPVEPVIQYVPTMPAGVSVNSRHAMCNTAPLQSNETWQGLLQGKLDGLLTTTLLDSTQLALGVFDLTDNNWLYCVNVQQRMRPASNMKVVTSIAALDCLGADYRYVPTVVKPGWGWCWDDEETGFTTATQKSKNKNPNVLWQENREWSVGEVLIPMMKKSDNMLAESMFWQLAEKRAWATRKECAAKVANVISKTGLNPNNYSIADGSGLSLYNYVSAELLISLLRYAYNNKVIYDQLYPAMPIAGVDGTLAKRMIGTPAENNVHAKTGSVTGVSSLSGYCTASNGHLLCFSIINCGLESMAPGRAFQNRVCATLCE